MELIQQLMQQVGVNQEQAEGGVGLLLNAAKEKLSGDNFSELTNAIPGADQFMSAAPSEEDSGGGMMGALGGIASSLGVGGGSLGTVASLLGGFSKLGIDGDSAKQFLPVVQNFLEGKLGGGTMDALKKLIS